MQITTGYTADAIEASTAAKLEARKKAPVVRG
jgi:hypothetical protein